jgi:hypothetical protein
LGSFNPVLAVESESFRQSQKACGQIVADQSPGSERSTPKFGDLVTAEEMVAFVGRSKRTGQNEVGHPDQQINQKKNAAVEMESLDRQPEGINHCLLKRRNIQMPMSMKRRFGNQTRSSGCSFAFARKVSAMMMKRK